MRVGHDKIKFNEENEKEKKLQKYALCVEQKRCRTIISSHFNNLHYSQFNKAFQLAEIEETSIWKGSIINQRQQQRTLLSQILNGHSYAVKLSL